MNNLKNNISDLKDKLSKMEDKLIISKEKRKGKLLNVKDDQRFYEI